MAQQPQWRIAFLCVLCALCEPMLFSAQVEGESMPKKKTEAAVAGISLPELRQRIDSVDKSGSSKVHAVGAGGKVATLPTTIYSPKPKG